MNFKILNSKTFYFRKYCKRNRKHLWLRNYEKFILMFINSSRQRMHSFKRSLNPQLCYFAFVNQYLQAFFHCISPSSSLQIKVVRFFLTFISILLHFTTLKKCPLPFPLYFIPSGSLSLIRALPSPWYRM